MSIKLPGYKLTKDGKITKDIAAQEAKMSVSTRIKRRSSKKIKIAPVSKGSAS